MLCDYCPFPNYVAVLMPGESATGEKARSCLPLFYDKWVSDRSAFDSGFCNQKTELFASETHSWELSRAQSAGTCPSTRPRDSHRWGCSSGGRLGVQRGSEHLLGTCAPCPARLSLTHGQGAVVLPVRKALGRGSSEARSSASEPLVDPRKYCL